MKLPSVLLSISFVTSLVVASRQSPDQTIFVPSSSSFSPESFDASIDPVELYVSLQPEKKSEFSRPVLLQIAGSAAKPEWFTEGDKLRLRKEGIKFRDLTGFEDLFGGSKLQEKSEANENKTYPTPGRGMLGGKVRSIQKTLKADNLRSNLEKLTSFYSRYYATHQGQESSEWLYLQILDIIKDAPAGTVISLSKFVHAFPQFSIVARFEPAETLPATQPAVIIGAHQDSANYLFPLLPAPGADDDGSGTVTILEAFRGLAIAGFKPVKPVEFHWYAAEEGGLLGSADLVKSYVELGKQVEAMIQFDMTAYNNPNISETLTFITSDTTKSLTEWGMDLAKTYSKVPVNGADLFPGAGSDHMSWYTAGFPAIFACEGDPNKAGFDPYIHGIYDTDRKSVV